MKTYLIKFINEIFVNGKKNNRINCKICFMKDLGSKDKICFMKNRQQSSGRRNDDCCFFLDD